MKALYYWGSRRFMAFSVGLPKTFLITAVIWAVFAVMGSTPLCAQPPKLEPTFADVSFGPSPVQLMDVYLPKGAQEAKEPIPVLLWYGGIWRASKGIPDLNNFLPKGVALIAVQTRAMEDAGREGIKPLISVVLMDAVRAVQFVRFNAKKWNIDPNRIGVAGGSQGGIPATYVACVAEQAKPASNDPVEQQSSKIVCAGGWRIQPTIDPKALQEWVPGLKWGQPALDCGFDESLARWDELQPLLKKWASNFLVTKDMAPMFLEYDYGLEKPDNTDLENYKIHSPHLGLGFQKLAREKGAACCIVKCPGMPSEQYKNVWVFLVEKLKEKP